MEELKSFLNTRNDISDEQRKKIEDCFGYYCDMFAKDVVVNDNWWVTPNAPSFSDEVSWKNKKFVGQVGGIKRGDSHKSPFDNQKNTERRKSKKSV